MGSVASTIDLSSLLQAVSGSSSQGINVNSAVAAAIYAARAPERQWQAQQQTLDTKSSAVTQLSNAVSSLETALDSLGDPLGAISAAKSVSSKPEYVTATAAPGTAIIDHTVAVTELAQTGSWYSEAVDPTAKLTSSVLNIKTGGTTTTISIGSDASTLNDLADFINKKALGINASIVNDIHGSRLALVSAQAGSAGDFSVSYPTIAFAQNTSATTTEWDSGSLESGSSLLSPETITVSAGGASTTIAIGVEASTLDELASVINGKNMGITASVVADSTGAHLAISSNNTSTSDLSVTNDPNPPKSINFTQARAGKDAQLTVDGIPLTSGSNTINGAIPGVTLTLTGKGESTISVTPDADQVTQAITSFVNSYNNIIKGLNTQFTYNAAVKQAGPLSDDSGARMLQNLLLNSITYQSSSSDTLPTLRSLGVNMNDDGTVTLDATKLNDAIQNHLSSVKSFLQGNASNGFVHSLSTQVSMLSDPTNGSFTVDLKSIASEKRALQDEVDNFEVYISSQQKYLTEMYSKAEEQLQGLPAQLQQINAILGNNSGSGR